MRNPYFSGFALGILCLMAMGAARGWNTPVSKGNVHAFGTSYPTRPADGFHLIPNECASGFTFAYVWDAFPVLVGTQDTFRVVSGGVADTVYKEVGNDMELSYPKGIDTLTVLGQQFDLNDYAIEAVK